MVLFTVAAAHLFHLMLCLVHGRFSTAVRDGLLDFGCTECVIQELTFLLILQVYVGANLSHIQCIIDY